MTNRPKKKVGKELREDSISRRDAIKKMGYVALSAATMMVLLNSQSAKAASNAPEAPTAPDPGGGGSPIWN
ncbi:MAG: hypothetical protein PHV20_11580 [Bacteroidales bacterium]|nr:hypothetical protein [Bacteroidales bacterium]